MHHLGIIKCCIKRYFYSCFPVSIQSLKTLIPCIRLSAGCSIYNCILVLCQSYCHSIISSNSCSI